MTLATDWDPAGAREDHEARVGFLVTLGPYILETECLRGFQPLEHVTTELLGLPQGQMTHVCERT